MVQLKYITPILIVALWSLSPVLALAQNNWEAPKEAQQLENPLDKSDRVLNAGKQIFAQLCTVCHGKAGKGDGVTASALQPKPADLTSEAMQAQTDGAIYWKLQEGRPPMPGFKSQLSEQQAWAVVHYIRSLNTDK
ncbi:MAG: c-type cytochrome [Gracilimonas sp.]|uniref:c-type cytochrome n=1 Tax=Gracilimonas sp. TaxID=1974203 RepID=UPI003750E1ED|nr:c-type cytochrome [Gracilimonas sp.]